MTADKIDVKNLPIYHFVQCSFCKKNRKQVKFVVSAHPTYICNECIEVCLEIKNEYDDKQAGKLTVKAEPK